MEDKDIITLRDVLLEILEGGQYIPMSNYKRRELADKLREIDK